MIRKTTHSYQHSKKSDPKKKKKQKQKQKPKPAQNHVSTHRVAKETQKKVENS